MSNINPNKTGRDRSGTVAFRGLIFVFSLFLSLLGEIQSVYSASFPEKRSFLGCLSENALQSNVRPQATASASTMTFLLNENLIYGVLAYNNSQMTPLAGVPLHLRAMPGFVVMSDTTNSAGSFRMSGFPDGNYILDASVDYQPGGINSTDALTATQIFASFSVLPPLQTRAGDVNGNGALNTSDALIISRFTTQMISAFSIGRFVQSHPTLSAQGDTLNINLWVLSAGDLNGSYEPLSTAPTLVLDSVYGNGLLAFADVRFLVPGSGVYERGICWSTASNPDTSNNKTVSGRGSFDFLQQFSGLTGGNTYHIRAYATNALGTSYSNERILPFVSLPSVETVRAIQLGDSDVVCEGIVNSDGGSAVVERGFVYDTVPGPLRTGTYTPIGSGAGPYSDTIGGLYPSTTYYFRSYANNSLGTAYGNDWAVTLCLIPRMGSGSSNLCAGSTDAFSASPAGGIWSSSNPTVAMVNANTGLVTAMSPGTATITYTISGTGGCPNATASRTLVITAPVNAGVLSGNQNLCVGSSDTYVSTVSGGSWSSGNSTVAMVVAGTGVVTALTPGTAAITYTLSGSGGCPNATASRNLTVCVALPSLTTLTATSITSSGASTGGVVTSSGGASVSARGVAYATTANPTLANLFTSNGTGTGTFNSVLTGLAPATAYRVRAYATNSSGTAYGNEIMFATPAETPTLTTSSISLITHNSAQSGATISTDGGAAVTQRGVCWSTSTQPTIANTRTQDGTGTGVFASSLTGLTSSTNYFVRAYATNSAGTAYGQQLTFTTTVPFVCGTSQATDVDGNNYATITLNLTINSQLRPICWFKQSLRVSKYRNGDPIPTGLDTSAWRSATSGAIASPNDSVVYDSAYGKLYNWYAVADARGICPTNWHVATDAEYLALTNFCQNNGYPNSSSNRNGTARALKSCRQINTPYSTACNTTVHPRWLAHNNTNPHYGIDAFGFSALPAGARVGDDGTFQAFGGNMLLQTPNLSPTDLNYGYLLRLDAGNFTRATGLKTWGGSVRCVRNY
ncbi:MAG: hypothetical protein FJ344_07550 [Sphingomonadales bacterium]|nr:hypothetical protein [Sphingomonadales bacterium]